ncbi:MAG: glycogen-binding domain-containing protein [Gemmatimonadales bacterium]
MPRSPALFIIAALAAVGQRDVSAQTDASVGFGLGTVRYSGATSFGIASLGPVLRLLAPGREMSLGGTLTALPRGDWYTQGRAALWASTPVFDNRSRLAIDLGLSGATQGAGTGTGAGLLVAEALWVAPTWGVGIGAGPASGWITHDAPITAFYSRLRGWWQVPAAPLTLSAALAPTRFPRDWFTDLDVRVSARRGRLEAGLSTSVRVSGVYGSKAAALATAEWQLSPRVTFEAGGGSLLPDPYQGFPRSGFVAAGVRLHFPTRARIAPVKRAGPLSISRRDGSLVLKLHRPGAQTVSIAGNWTGWTPVPFTQLGNDAWQVVLRLTNGIHYFTLFIDGVGWTIPDDVPSVPDGLGGRVAVLTVL